MEYAVAEKLGKQYFAVFEQLCTIWESFRLYT